MNKQQLTQFLSLFISLSIVQSFKLFAGRDDIDPKLRQQPSSEFLKLSNFSIINNVDYNTKAQTEARYIKDPTAIIACSNTTSKAIIEMCNTC